MVDIEARAHRNFSDWLRWTVNSEPGAETIEASGIVAIAGLIDFPTSRAAIRTDRSLPPKEWAATVGTFFSERGKTAAVHARIGADDDLTAELAELGFREWTTTPEMVCDIAPDARDAPTGFSVRLAATPADIAAYANIAAEAFAHLHLPRDSTLDAVDRPDAYLAGNSVVALAELDGVPVAGAHVLLHTENRSAYVAWVSCADSARGHGLGDRVTRAVTREAFRRGADLVTLEASQFGEHTYARMGYREIYRYRMLLRL